MSHRYSKCLFLHFSGNSYANLGTLTNIEQKLKDNHSLGHSQNNI